MHRVLTESCELAFRARKRRACLCSASLVRQHRSGEQVKLHSRERIVYLVAQRGNAIDRAPCVSVSAHLQRQLNAFDAADKLFPHVTRCERTMKARIQQIGRTLFLPLITQRACERMLREPNKFTVYRALGSRN